MNQFQLTDVIEEELPEIYEELENTSVFGDAIKVMQITTDYSKKMLSIHELNKVLKCMKLIGRIYDRGNKTVRSAVESVYVFSFSAMQVASNKIDWNIVRAKMPMTLYSLYVRQLNGSRFNQVELL